MQEGNRLHYLADRAGIRGRFSDADAYHPDQAFPLLMKQPELMLTTCDVADTYSNSGSCGCGDARIGGVVISLLKSSKSC